MNKRPPRNGEVRVQIQNTLLVDGNALFKTGFFGAKNQYNHSGDHVGGLYQFLTQLRKLLVDDLYHQVYVFWDGNYSGKLRYDIYEPYKSGRGKDYVNGTKPIEPDELKQMFMCQEYLEELFIRQLKHNIIESDDFIAYYCLNKQDNEKVTICTSDRDLAQLISDTVKIYFLDLKVYVDLTNYSSYFCHHQSNVALLKTMVGDVSDTIKGVKGLGEPTLLNLFPDFKTREVTLEEIIEKSKVLQDERVKNKKKPLAVLDNIINGITDGVQGNKLYEINNKLVNLKTPLLTEDGIEEFNKLTNNTLNADDRSIKNVFIKLKRDGIDKIIGEQRYNEYLIPFKKLKEREIKSAIN